MGMRKVCLLTVLFLGCVNGVEAFQTANSRPFSNRRRRIQTRVNRPQPDSKQNHPLTPARQYSTTRLEASPLSVFASPLGSVLVLATVVVVHESGHYLAARWAGAKVDEFAVGFGPKVAGFEAFGNNFTLRALPLGGYVRFPENYNATQVYEDERAAQEALDEFEANRAKPESVAQQVLRALTFGAIKDKELEAEKARRRALAESAGTKKTPWWQIAKPSSEPALPIIMDPDDVQIEYYDDPNLLQNKSWIKRAVVISGGVVLNLVLALTIYFGQISFGPGLPQPVFETGVKVTSMPRPEAPASGLLSKGDVVLTVQGRPLTVSESPTALEASRAIDAFIQTIRATPEGEKLELTVRHANKDNIDTISIIPTRVDPGAPQTIGVLLQPNFVKQELVQSKNPAVAFQLAFDSVYGITRETATALIGILGGLIKGNGPGGSVSGPIGLIQTGSQVVATQDWTTVLMFMAAISVNMGVLNAFPIPALDGGQLVFILFEGLTGRKVAQRFQEGLTGIAILLLLLVSVGTAVGDVGAILSSSGR